MRRTSLYASTTALDALDHAVETLTTRLGPGTPRHVALSALLLAAADQTDTVTTRLLTERTAHLTAELERLKHP